jgi:DNA invertase Pin-like site-specific DNA recombinase
LAEQEKSLSDSYAQVQDILPNSIVQPIRAARYVRMSTEHQRYSTQNQADEISQYAREHGMVIVRTFADDGKSGLNLEGRAGLLQLLSEVQSGKADFSAVLVYDVSRWGRFQDADESGYWEYVCKRAGVSIHYCAEQFANDGSLPSVILKNLKRTMAGEYSRELSVKVFAGQCRLIELGYRQGGPAGYGLRRLLIDEESRPKGLMERGHRKSLQTDRVILIPGPAPERRIVQEIYHAFVNEGKTEREIAEDLNSRAIPRSSTRPWSRGSVHQILVNPKYIGSNVYNRKSFKLKQRRVANPEAMWVRKEDAFEALVSHELFVGAAEKIETRSHRFTDDEMLSMLRRLLAKEGRLSGILIDEFDEMPSSSVYKNRFGSLTRVYSLIGYNPQRDYGYVEVNRALRILHLQHFDGITEQLRSSGAHVEANSSTGVLTINGDFTAEVVIARCRVPPNGHLRWVIHLDGSNDSDITIAARMSEDNNQILDYYFLPRRDELSARIQLAWENPLVIEVYHFDDLHLLYAMSKRVRIGDAA